MLERILAWQLPRLIKWTDNKRSDVTKGSVRVRQLMVREGIYDALTVAHTNIWSVCSWVQILARWRWDPRGHQKGAGRRGYPDVPSLLGVYLGKRTLVLKIVWIFIDCLQKKDNVYVWVNTFKCEEKSSALYNECGIKDTPLPVSISILTVCCQF